MIVLSLNNIKKLFGVDVVLKDVSLTLQDNNRMGIVGPNGAGKTTLMRIITGEENYDSGRVSMGSKIKFGYLKQEPNMSSGQTVYETLKDVYTPVFAMEDRMREIETLMGSPDMDERAWERISDEYNELLQTFDEKGGYSWKSLIQGVMSGLGLPNELKNQEVSTLSGGQLARLALGVLLLQRPDILLLDEPTNHLDTKAITWLEGYLNTWNGTVIIVSHDRWFLDRVCTHIGHLHHGIMDEYKGNYTDFVNQRAEKRRLHQIAYDNNQKEIKRQQAIIDQYYIWARSKGDGGKNFKKAQAREKMLARLERVPPPMSELEKIHLQLDTDRRSGKDVLFAEDVSMAFDTTLFTDCNLHILRGNRIALLGENGVGKTSLLRLIAGELEPIKGSIKLGAGVKLGYYDQMQGKLDGDKTVMDELWDRFPKLLPQQIRNALGTFLFRGDDVFKKVASLSGGERGRLSLLKLMIGKENFLLLDEPTNHLDIDSREKLEKALLEFDGTLLFVSHDRYFIQKVSDHIMEIKDKSVYCYPGNWTDYLEHNKKLEQAEPTIIAKPSITKTAQRKQKQAQKQKSQAVKQQEDMLYALEADIMELEERKDALDALLSRPETLDKTEISGYTREYDSIINKLETLMIEWEDMSSSTQ